MAEDALVVLSRHLPVGTDFGRPVVALAGEPGQTVFLMALDADREAVWYVDENEASRMIALPDGLIESVTFVKGSETERIVAYERDIRPCG